MNRLLQFHKFLFIKVLEIFTNQNYLLIKLFTNQNKVLELCTATCLCTQIYETVNNRFLLFQLSKTLSNDYLKKSH